MFNANLRIHYIFNCHSHSSSVVYKAVFSFGCRIIPENSSSIARIPSQVQSLAADLILFPFVDTCNCLIRV